MLHAPCWLADGRPAQCHTPGPYHQAQIRIRFRFRFPSTNASNGYVATSSLRCCCYFRSPGRRRTRTRSLAAPGLCPQTVSGPALVSCRHACRAPCPPSVKQVPTVRKSLHRLSIYSNLLVVSARPCHQVQVCQPLDQVQPRRRLNHPAHLALLQPECRFLKLLLHVATPKESPKQSY
jgi:hypothetical protein